MERTCFNCGKILKRSENSHIRKCNSNLSYKEARFRQLIFDFSDIDLSANNLKKLYLIEQNSMLDLKNKFKLAYRQIYFLLDYYSINKRNKDEIKTIKKEKYKNTCIEKYGIEHSTTKDTLSKIKNTCIEKYGVDNIFKSKDFIEESILKKREKYNKAGLGWINETNESKEERLKKLHYNCKKWWINMDKSEKNNRILILKNNRLRWWYNLSDNEKCSFLENMKNNYESAIEKRIVNILDLKNIKYKTQYWINKKSYDILVENKIIEVNGDFWHCNPDKYDKNFLHPYLKIKASEIWEKDKWKKDNAKKYGFDVVTIWEDFINKNSDEEVFKYLQNFINF